MSVTIHDHFDGEHHCVECDGPCRLEGDALLATQLVRFVFEQAEINRTEIPSMIRFSLERSGVDIARLWKRCRETGKWSGNWPERKQVAR